MTKKARSARGELVDFDLLAIKQQLATTPVPVAVDQRRKFIDEKDGVKTREMFTAAKTTIQANEPGPLDVATASLKKSAAAK